MSMSSALLLSFVVIGHAVVYIALSYGLYNGYILCCCFFFSMCLCLSFFFTSISIDLEYNHGHSIHSSFSTTKIPLFIHIGFRLTFIHSFGLTATGWKVRVLKTTLNGTTTEHYDFFITSESMRTHLILCIVVSCVCRFDFSIVLFVICLVGW